MAWVVANQLTGAGAGRFGVKRNVQIVSIPVIAASTRIPTEIEIEGGTEITCAIDSLSGFTASDRYAELSDLCSEFDGKVWDGASLDDSSITFWLDKTFTGDAFDLYTSGDDVSLLHAPYGLVDAAPALVWDMTVGSVLPPLLTSGAAVVNVAFSPRALTKITLPAST